jgi:hypothetical protein
MTRRARPFPRFLMFSANVDHDGDRYGFVGSSSPHRTKANMRASKALHLLNTAGSSDRKGRG